MVQLNARMDLIQRDTIQVSFRSRLESQRKLLPEEKKICLVMQSSGIYEGCPVEC